MMFARQCIRSRQLLHFSPLFRSSDLVSHGFNLKSRWPIRLMTARRCACTKISIVRPNNLPVTRALIGGLIKPFFPHWENLRNEFLHPLLPLPPHPLILATFGVLGLFPPTLLT